MDFYDPKGNRIKIAHIAEEIIKKINCYPKANYKIIIGTDSQRKGKKLTFITVIVLYRVGKGGTYYIRKNIVPTPVTLKEKIYKEAQLSIETAEKIKQLINDNKLNGFLEVHVDVGEHGDTKNLIREVIDFIEKKGYQTTIKPNSFAASKVADKHTK